MVREGLKTGITLETTIHKRRMKAYASQQLDFGHCHLTSKTISNNYFFKSQPGSLHVPKPL